MAGLPKHHLPVLDLLVDTYEADPARVLSLDFLSLRTQTPIDSVRRSCLYLIRKGLARHAFGRLDEYAEAGGAGYAATGEQLAMISGARVKKFERGWAIPVMSFGAAHYFERRDLGLAVSLCGIEKPAGHLLHEGGWKKRCKRCERAAGTKRRAAS